MCNRTPECIGLQVVCKTASAVDLDDRQPLAILGFQRFVACDVDLAQVEVQLLSERTHLFERAFAQVAPLRVVHDDVRQLTQMDYG